MKKQPGTSWRGWLFAAAGSLAAATLCHAQMMVRADANGDSDELQAAAAVRVLGGPGGQTARPVSSGAGADVAADGFVAADEETLIRALRAQAGPVGPRKLFSATRFEATAGLAVTGDDNILLSSTGPRRGDVIVSIVGGARLLLGDFANRADTYAVIGYTGTGNVFARYGREDCYDQDAVLDVLYRKHQLAINSLGIFQDRHEATADLGQRVGHRLFGEGLTLKYYRNDLTTLSAGARYEYDSYDTSIETSDLLVNAALDYALTGKITVGAGAVFGRLAASGGVQEYSEQAQVRFGYAITHKIDVAATGGIEYRERGAGAGDSVTPVFSVTGRWTPWSGTAFDLEAHRRTEASGSLGGEDFVDTGFQLGVRQDLFQRFYARLDLGFQNADYQNATDAEPVPRTDNYFSIRATAGYDFVHWLRLLAFYEHRQDDSTRQNFTFVSNRVGMEVSLNY